MMFTWKFPVIVGAMTITDYSILAGALIAGFFLITNYLRKQGKATPIRDQLDEIVDEVLSRIDNRDGNPQDTHSYVEAYKTIKSLYPDHLPSNVTLEEVHHKIAAMVLDSEGVPFEGDS